MKSKNKQKTLILMIIGTLFLLSMGISNQFNPAGGNNDNFGLENIDYKLSKISGKIHIVNNSGWAAAKVAGICTGEGSYSNPYIIEDLVIDGGDVGSCILIENSTVYFKLINCSLVHASDVDINEATLKLYNVSNCQIINSTFRRSYVGIFAYVCNNLTLFGNIIRYVDRGFRMVNCEDAYAYFNDFRGEIYDLFIQDSTLRFYSLNKINYTYNGQVYNNYLGNFWKDYPGSDEDNDGIGDEIHHFEDGVGIDVDLYPLITLIENYKIGGVIPEEPNGGEEPNGILGYDLYLLIGILSIVSLIISKRIKKY